MNENTISQSNAVSVNAQYIKDFSFENPQAPSSFIKNEQPRVDIALDIDVKNIGNNVFEVVLSTQAKASLNNETVFLIELQYAGIFTLNNIEESQKEKVLLVYCPNIIFPYARRIISDVTRDGGYPPMMIAPIDFLDLYEQRKHNIKNGKDITIN